LMLPTSAHSPEPTVCLKSNAGSDGLGEEGKHDGSIWSNIGHKLDEVKQTVGISGLISGSRASFQISSANDPGERESSRWSFWTVAGSEEQEFRQQRQRKVVKALSSYLNIPEDDIHPDDVHIGVPCLLPDIVC
jgi:phospholipase A2